MEQARPRQPKVRQGDWVTDETLASPIGFVKRVAHDGSWADVDWRTHTKRMPTWALHIQATIKIGKWEVTDLARKWELEAQHQQQGGVSDV